MANSKTTATNTNYYVILGLAAALAVLATIYFGQSLAKTISHNSKVNNKLNVANKQLTANVAASSQLVNDYNALGATQITITNALPKTSDFSGFIALLENAANFSSVQLNTVSPTNQSATTSAAVANSSQQTLGFSIAVTGSYENIKKMLTAVQMSARPIVITSIELSGTGSTMVMNLTGYAYYQPDVSLPFKTEMVK